MASATAIDTTLGTVPSLGGESAGGAPDRLQTNRALNTVG
jgi:hypothetical protein